MAERDRLPEEMGSSYGNPLPSLLSLQEAFQQEFATLLQTDRRVTLELNPADAWYLLSTIQLALRHPAFKTYSFYPAVRDLARRLQQLAAPSPAMQAVAEMGWEPRYDQR